MRQEYYNNLLKRSPKMSVFIDVCLCVIFAFFVFWFSKNGFAYTVYKIGKTWLSLLCSIVLGPYVTTSLQKWFLLDAVTTGVNNTLVQCVENNPNGYNLEQLFDNLPSGFVTFLEHVGISLPELEAIYGPSTETSEEILAEIARRIAAPCADALATIVGHIVCFVVTLIFFAWLKFEIRKRRIAFLRYIDHAIGFVAGIAIGYCAIWGISLLVSTTFQVLVAFDANSPVISIYNNSHILKFLNEFNVFNAIRQM